jgi:hypothetical protein
MNLEGEKVVYISAILLQAGVLIFFLRRTMKKKKAISEPASPYPPGSYEQLRHTAIQVTAQQLGLSMQPAVTKVYGIIMDWDMNGTVLTLSSYITGAANAFLSSGASITGVGTRPEIAEHASDFVQVAQNYLGKCMPVSDTGLPIPGTVRFYLLTNNGIYGAQELLSSIDDGSSPWIGLFFKGNMLLDEIKQAEDK